MNQENPTSTVSTAKPAGRFSHLRPFDALNIIYLIFLSVLVLFFSAKIQVWMMLIASNLLGAMIIYFISLPPLPSQGRFIRIIRDWYSAPLIFLAFKEVYIIIQGLARNDFDYLLIDLDRKLFGCDPTIWLARFTTPFLTEILQLAYASYFIIMLTVGVELYLRKEDDPYIRYTFTLMLGFFTSYLGYLLVPAVGPRFTLHDFSHLDRELPGLFFAVPIRSFINGAESIPVNGAGAWLLAQRDAFPSGHTAMTLIALFFATKYRIASRWYLYVAGTLLIIATVYLRYHYVIDLIGGAVTMIMVVWVGSKILKRWEKNRQQTGQ
jgi:membrane-associated phospholipid phosphatase